jgi:hypothetical protein
MRFLHSHFLVGSTFSVRNGPPSFREALWRYKNK